MTDSDKLDEILAYVRECKAEAHGHELVCKLFRLLSYAVGIAAVSVVACKNSDCNACMRFHDFVVTMEKDLPIEVFADIKGGLETVGYKYE